MNQFDQIQWNQWIGNGINSLFLIHSFILLSFCFPFIHSSIHPFSFAPNSPIHHSLHSPTNNPSKIHSTLPLLLPMTQLPLLDPLLRVHSPRIIRRRQHLPLRVRRRIHNLPIGLLAHSLRELLHRRRRRQRDLRSHLQTLHLRQTGRMRGRKHLLRLGITRWTRGAYHPGLFVLHR